jgi:hypothetical protein
MAVIADARSWLQEQMAESREIWWAFRIIAVLLTAILLMWLGLVIRDITSPQPTEEELIEDAGRNPDVELATERARSSETRDDDGVSTLAVAGGALAFIVVAAAMVVLAVMAVAGMMRLGRERGPKFRELSASEQQRRREAAELLRDPDPS